MPDAKLGLYTHLLPTAHKTIRLEGGFDRVVALHLNQLTSATPFDCRHLPLDVTAQPTPWQKSAFVSIVYETDVICRS
jgi:hypothetical protein